MIDEIDKMLTHLPQSVTFAGCSRQLIVDQDQQDLTAGIPRPPFAVHDREHLITLLQEGVDSLDRGEGVEATSS